MGCGICMQWEFIYRVVQNKVKPYILPISSENVIQRKRFLVHSEHSSYSVILQHNRTQVIRKLFEMCVHN